MKIAILGYDVEGRASFDYFAAQGGHELAIRDQNSDKQVPEGVSTVLGDAYLDDLDQFDLFVRTAGLPPQKILDKNPGVAAKITSHLNEFMKVSPTQEYHRRHRHQGQRHYQHPDHRNAGSRRQKG